jgi:hypothetical protein
VAFSSLSASSILFKSSMFAQLLLVAPSNSLTGEQAASHDDLMAAWCAGDVWSDTDTAVLGFDGGVDGAGPEQSPTPGGDERKALRLSFAPKASHTRGREGENGNIRHTGECACWTCSELPLERLRLVRALRFLHASPPQLHLQPARPPGWARSRRARIRCSLSAPPSRSRARARGWGSSAACKLLRPWNGTWDSLRA